MEKHPHMERALNRLANDLFGRDRSESCCVCCGSDAVRPNDFRDDLSRKEFGISRMCQDCQDGVFGVSDL